MNLAESRAQGCLTRGPVECLRFVEAAHGTAKALLTTVDGWLNTDSECVGSYENGEGTYRTARGSLFTMKMTREVWQMKCNAFWGMK